jgi:hypothetical protein
MSGTRNRIRILRWCSEGLGRHIFGPQAIHGVVRISSADSIGKRDDRR